MEIDALEVLSCLFKSIEFCCKNTAITDFEPDRAINMKAKIE